jgi:hypothetical protein
MLLVARTIFGGTEFCPYPMNVISVETTTLLCRHFCLPLGLWCGDKAEQ